MQGLRVLIPPLGDLVSWRRKGPGPSAIHTSPALDTHTLANAQEVPVPAKDPRTCPGSHSGGTSVVLRPGLVACPDGPTWL